MKVHYIVLFPASYSPFHATPLSSCQQTCSEHTTRACFTRGCWHLITKIFGFRTLLTSKIIVPNKSPQCTNSTGKFESNFVPVFTIWIPIFWEISMQQWRRVRKRHINSNSAKICTIVNEWGSIVICYDCLLFAILLNFKESFLQFLFDMICRDVIDSIAVFFSNFWRYLWHVWEISMTQSIWACRQRGAATEQCSMLWAPMQIHELDSYHTITHGAFARAVSLQCAPMHMQIHLAPMRMRESGSYHRSTLFSIPPLSHRCSPAFCNRVLRRFFCFLFFCGLPHEPFKLFEQRLYHKFEKYIG